MLNKGTKEPRNKNKQTQMIISVVTGPSLRIMKYLFMKINVHHTGYKSIFSVRVCSHSYSTQPIFIFIIILMNAKRARHELL